MWKSRCRVASVLPHSGARRLECVSNNVCGSTWLAGVHMNIAQRDLDLASDEIEKMADATAFSRFEVAWQTFLFRVERAWERAESVMRKNPSWQRWISKHSSMRKKDPLLRFIRQARNAETHVVSATVGKDVVISLKERTGQPFSIDRIEVSFEDGILTWNVCSEDKTLSLEPTLMPGNPKLIRFENRGAWYNPPVEHLGKRLQDLHPVAVAMLCVDYYRVAIDEAEKLLARS